MHSEQLLNCSFSVSGRTRRATLQGGKEKYRLVGDSPSIDAGGWIGCGNGDVKWNSTCT
jgi:hypothetical protein